MIILCYKVASGFYYLKAQIYKRLAPNDPSLNRSHTPRVEFHFILAFANKEYNEDGKSNGNFIETWNEVYFGPEKVKKLKENFPNVKVIISIGGRGVETPFDPAEGSISTRNVVHSLKVLIGKYKSVSGNIIDGIDINYETIKTNNDLFVKGIGQVIIKLRNDDNLNIDVMSVVKNNVKNKI
ncbi:chitinase 2-like [Vicia villosa]|uniref:chitinase 2-like n=1 Tax=Vicia villosa TaxID=3911 RepID=UPI00273B9E58|nr:chitinase 2-like [Vicia villosa]